MSASSTSPTGASPAPGAHDAAATPSTKASPRAFSAYEHSLMRAAHAGAMTMSALRNALRCSHDAMYREMAALGLPRRGPGRPAQAVEAAKGGRAHGGGGSKRVFTAAEREIIQKAARGEMSRDDARRELRTNHRTLVTALAEFGAQAKIYQRRSPMQPAPKGSPAWIPIAHGCSGKWRPYDGAPVTIEAARIAVDAGCATMAQRRIDGEFDLLFRWVRA